MTRGARDGGRAGMRAWRSAAGVLVVWSAAALADDRAGATGDASLLRQVIAAHQDNRQRVATWRGQARVEHEGHDVADPAPGRASEELEVATIGFARDGSRHRADWTDQQLRSAVRRRGADGAPLAGFSRTMKKEDGLYRYSGGLGPEGARPQLVIFPPDEKPFYKDFDPAAYLARDGTNQDIEARLSGFCEKLTKPPAALPADVVRTDTRVRREGSVVILENELQRAGEGPIVDRCRFDLSAGGNLVFHEHEDALGRTVAEMTYERQAGVWVPRTYRRARSIRGRRDVPVRMLIEKVTFEENMVNAGVPEEAFCLAGLGVAEGDVIVDRRNRAVPIVYRYATGAGPDGELGTLVARLGPEADAAVPADAAAGKAAAKPEPDDRLGTAPGLPASGVTEGPRSRGRGGLRWLVAGGAVVAGLVLALVARDVRRHLRSGAARA